MSERTGIAWCHHTHNIAWGCEQVSPGCANCYAKALAERYRFKIWGPETAERRTFGAAHWAAPRKWNRKAMKDGVRRRVFCSSMADVFEDNGTIAAEREKLWPLIRATSQLDWLLLTKRAEHIRASLPADWGEGYANVWLGVSVENQRWTSRIPELLAIPAVVHFLSCEPLLGPVAIGEYLPNPLWNDLASWKQNEIDWVIAGGESGAGRREMSVDAFTNLHEQCAVAGVPFFAKQDSAARSGERGRIPDRAWVQEFPTVRAA